MITHTVAAIHHHHHNHNHAPSSSFTDTSPASALSSSNSAELNSQSLSHSPATDSQSSCHTTPRSSQTTESAAAAAIMPNKRDGGGSFSLSSSVSSTSSISCSSYEQQQTTKADGNPFKYASQAAAKQLSLIQSRMELSPSQSYRKLEDIITEADNLTLNSVLVGEQALKNSSQVNARDELEEQKRVKSILRKYNCPVEAKSNIAASVEVSTLKGGMAKLIDNYRATSYYNSSKAQQQQPSQKSKAQVNDSDLIDKTSCVLPSKLKAQTTPTPITTPTTATANSNRTSSGMQRGSFSTGSSYSKSPDNASLNESTTTTTSVGYRSWSSANSNTPVRSPSTGTFVKNNAAGCSSVASNAGVGAVKRGATRNAATAREALIRWCSKMTENYDKVSITNFSSSWADGMAFCALVHRFLPDEFDFSKLSPANRRHNFNLAFTVAE